jgi:hypothetical protein
MKVIATEKETNPAKLLNILNLSPAETVTGVGLVGVEVGEEVGVVTVTFGVGVETITMVPVLVLLMLLVAVDTAAQFGDWGMSLALVPVTISKFAQVIRVLLAKCRTKLRLPK